MSKNPCFFSILPASVRHDTRLCAGAKILYSEISELTNAEGHCWASNNYFAKLYKVDERTITRWISKLQKAGHIEIIIKKIGLDKWDRKIYLKLANKTPKENSSYKCIIEKIFNPSDDFSILPAIIRYNTELSLSSKILYSEISALTHVNGYCSQSSNYFAKLYKVNERTIAEWLFELREAGHIEIITKKYGMEWDRKIYLKNGIEQQRKLPAVVVPSYIEQKGNKDDYI